MENLLFTIPQLVQNQKLVGTNNGLLNGNTGLAIFLYHFSRESHDTNCEEAADNLLDKVFEGITNAVPTDFENGLAGIGWGIQYLINKGFANGDTNEILQEVDTKVYRILCDPLLASFELTNGIIGYLYYLNSRLNVADDPYSMVYRINRELLISVINKLDELVCLQFSTILKEHYFDLFWRFPLTLYALTESYKLNIYNHKIEQIVKQFLMHFETYIPSLHINRLFMALALTQLNAIIPNKRLVKQSQILLFATNFEQMDSEFDPNHQGIRYGWPGAIWLLYMSKMCISPQMPNYNLIIKTHVEYVKRFKFKSAIDLNSAASNSLKPGISEGVAGIGLLELLWPNAFK